MSRKWQEQFARENKKKSKERKRAKILEKQRRETWLPSYG